LSVEKPLRELTIKETLSSAFNLYKSNFITFFIPMLMAGVVNGIMAIVVGYSTANLAALASEGFTSFFWISLVNLLPAVMVSALVSWVIGTLARGICVKYASDITTKGHADIRKTLGFVARKLVSLLSVALLTGIIIGVGLIALLVPGIILNLMFYLVVPVIIAENVGALESLSRSRMLVRKRWMKTFLLGLSVEIVVVSVSFLAGQISNLLPFDLYNVFVSSILSTVATPIIPISSTIYYYSMLARERPPSFSASPSQ
jgi:hypothetical protein